MTPAEKLLKAYGILAGVPVQISLLQQIGIPIMNAMELVHEAIKDLETSEEEEQAMTEDEI